MQEFPENERTDWLLILINRMTEQASLTASWMLKGRKIWTQVGDTAFLIEIKELDLKCKDDEH